MAKTGVTFEDVDKHIQSADLSAFQAGGKHHVAAGASAAAALPNVCGAYHVIKPILDLLLATPIIPKKWKDAIKAFEDVMNVVCP